LVSKIVSHCVGWEVVQDSRCVDLYVTMLCRRVVIKFILWLHLQVSDTRTV
jgi:hypothetical protein